MAFEHYIRSGRQLLRCGYTTGTCAALAAAGAATALLTGRFPETVGLRTPGGLYVEVPLRDCRTAEDRAVCGVVKDAGDDPDVTDGLTVRAEVRKIPRDVVIDGGEGVGRVTRPGLDQPVGAAAINRVPRQMIRSAVERVCAETGYQGGLAVTVSVPGGAEAAKRTFNPALGVEGGLSILGTSGIVEPMSERAILDTIALELRQAAVVGGDAVVLTPGNYGLSFLDSAPPAVAALPRVKCSNFPGQALDLAALEGFRQVLLVGHVGKLVKLAGGVFNTHSRVADCRRELFCAHAALCGAGRAVCRQLMEQVTADGCLSVLDGAGLREPVLESLLAAVQEHLDRRGSGAFQVGAVLFSNRYGLLGVTRGARELWEGWNET